jgi:hypothetical protein
MFDARRLALCRDRNRLQFRDLRRLAGRSQGLVSRRPEHHARQKRFGSGLRRMGEHFHTSDINHFPFSPQKVDSLATQFD